MFRITALAGLVVCVLLTACASHAAPGVTPFASPASTSAVILPTAEPLPSPAATKSPTQPNPATPELYPPAVQAAQSAAARDHQVPLANVTVVRFTPVEWRNGCLEVDRMERPCTDVIVPGYQVILGIDGQLVEYRTNLDGTQIVYAGPVASAATPATGDVTFTWHREGGIAGFCDELRIWDTGEAIASSCQRGVNDEVGRAMLLPAEIVQLETWLTTYGPINATVKDAAIADAMTQTLALAGRGQAAPTPAEEQAMLVWATAIAQRIVSDIQR